MKNKLLVLSSPFITKSLSVNAIMYCLMLALLPTAISGVVVFGIKALYIMLISVASGYIFDLLFGYIKERKFNYFDFSGVVSGLIMALILPVSVPLYYPIIGNFISMVLFKGFFGGNGKNIFNPSGVARVVLGLIFSALSLDLFAGIALKGEVLSPLYYFTLNDYSTITLRSLFFGTAPGAIGTSSIFCILVCGICLMIYRVTDYIIPIISVLAFTVTTWVGAGAVAIVPYLFSGSFLFVTMFMLTDPTSSPNTLGGKLVYGLVFGLISGLFRINHLLGETSVFVALLIANLLVPLVDKIFVPRPLGIRRDF